MHQGNRQAVQSVGMMAVSDEALQAVGEVGGACGGACNRENDDMVENVDNRRTGRIDRSSTR
jgi:hypothetical protein